MKVMMINGSPNREGCTYTALREVARSLEEDGIETELVHIGTQPIQGCAACGTCKRTRSRVCVFDGDSVNRIKEKVAGADGLVLGAPVHFASISGAMSTFLDRFFYSGGAFAYKPGAAVVSARRGGTTAALDQINKYFTITNMVVVGSQYWNMVHGNTPEEVRQDLEGMQTMRTLGRNMAWLLRCLDAGRAQGVKLPEPEARVRTNFIRNT